jgi:hypothetical protein
MKKTSLWDLASAIVTAFYFLFIAVRHYFFELEPSNYQCLLMVILVIQTYKPLK